MTDNKRINDALIAISAISNDKALDFKGKLNSILLEMVQCIRARSGSIMLVKGKKTLEVAASTNPELIGVKQSLDDETPSSWVVKNRTPLYVDNIHHSRRFKKRFDHYRKGAFVLAPIIADNKVIGVMSVTDKQGKDIFIKEEREILVHMAVQVISALENQRLTDTLKKKKKALQEKNKELKRLERLKTDLFRMLIHDLKGPISELMANLDILSYKVSEENLEYVDFAKGGCDTLYSMVSNLLDIARLEEGKLELFYERIDPEDLVKEALARLFGVVKMRNLTFFERFPALVEADRFWGDRGILLRVLQNLLTNAISYSPAGETIEVGFDYPKPNSIEFSLKDKGPGIPDEYKEAIFDKYTQLEKKRDGRIYTTGLGLTFCRMAVLAHGGEIGVESDGEHGSRFFFSLPLERKPID